MSQESFPLWSGDAPGALGQAPHDIPTLTVFRPEAGKANDASMLVLPGGGYHVLAPHEGEGYARWFASLGITAYVLAYRLGSNGYRHPCMHQDASRAMRWVRHLAKKEGRSSAKIGIIGSSAGGHLASTVLTHFDGGSVSSADEIERESSRPDAGILCYPVISLKSYTHQGSCLNLLGKDPSEDLLVYLSGELQVTPETPPCFIWHTMDDPGVPAENSLMFASALGRAQVPYDLHIYQHGAHGLGLPYLNPAAPAWDKACENWMKERGFL